jgi:hypothetical protein
MVNGGASGDGACRETTGPVQALMSKWAQAVDQGVVIRKSS